ncbi:hypothetical protein [Streptomyces sp. NPDC126933]|uniref:hypothetical protein n=1 Tax=unclassified Streptomyces TaxID=2593676 RepID=UPI003659A6E7
MSLNRTRPRTLAAVGFLAATGLFLTACGPEDSAADSSASASSSAGASSGADAPADAAGDTDASAENREDGTVTGTLTYLAPGKLEVDGRPFYLAEDTQIQGGEICGDPETPAVESCTPAEAEEAAQTGTVKAEVEIKKGIATKIVGGAGGGAGDTEASAKNRKDGTVTGTLTYLAPGKLEVDGRPFYLAEDTQIQGGEICGDPETPALESCTAEELEMAAKDGGMKVEVTIKKGIAERVAQA